MIRQSGLLVNVMRVMREFVVLMDTASDHMFASVDLHAAGICETILVSTRQEVHVYFLPLRQRSRTRSKKWFW